MFPSINVDVFHHLVHGNDSCGHQQSTVDFVLFNVCQRTAIGENAFLQDEEALMATQEDAACNTGRCSMCGVHSNISQQYII